MFDFNAKEAKDICVEWIRNWFEKNGKGCNAVVGISGGKDSSVTAALCVEALGKDRVIGVLMPNGHQSDISDAFHLCNHLDIKYVYVNIEHCISELDDAFRMNNHSKNHLHFEVSEQTKINLPPRIRMATLYAISQSINGRVACTDNLSEKFIGYSTRWGDDVGDFAPLRCFTSDEVVAVGEVLGIPDNLIHKAPADGLTGKTDEDNFGFTYKELNEFILTGMCENKEAEKKIWERYNKNLFKSLPISAPYLASNKKLLF